MNFTMTRATPDAGAVIGLLRDDVTALCFTLERYPPAIPNGIYRLELTVSTRAKAGELWTPDPRKRLPLVVDVPGHTGIRFHAGNSAADTRGCVIVGEYKIGNLMRNSRVALTALIDRMLLLGDEPIMLIVGPENADPTRIPDGGF